MTKKNVTRRSRSALLRLWLGCSCLSAFACGGSEKGTQSESARPRCSAARLESDLEAQPFAGPLVDEASGELKLAPGRAYVVSSTYGVPIPGEDGAPVTAQYAQLIGAIQAQLASQPGLLAVRLASSDACASGRTMAVWNSEEEMYAFVAGEAHFAAMKAVHDVLKPGYAVTHWTANDSEDISWSAAIKQLAEDER